MRVVHIAWLAAVAVGCSVAPIDRGDEVESTEEDLARNADSGATIWSRQLPSQAYAVTTDKGGDAYVFGWDTTQVRPTIHKYDPYGRLLWQKTLPFFAWASNRAPGFTGYEGQIFINGWSSPQEAPIDFGCGPISGYFLVHFSTDGACVWQRKIISESLAMEAAGVDSLGRAIIAGHYSGNTNFGTYYDNTGFWVTFIAAYERTGELA